MKKLFTLKSRKSKSLNGIIFVPSDKSISIRALIISSLCLGNSKIFNLLESDDVKHTLQSLKDLGVKILRKKVFMKFMVKEDYLKNQKKNYI